MEHGLEMNFKCSMLAWSGVAALIVQPDPQFYVLCGVLITSVAQIISSYMRHKWDREDRAIERAALREEVRGVAAVTLETKKEIREDIAANTAITQAAADTAVAAFDAANHTNEKIARLAGEISGKGNEVARDTNETVHRIDEKIDPGTGSG